MDFENGNNVEKTEINFCSHCGKAIKLGANFCAYCGCLLNENAEFDKCPNCNQRTLKHTLSSDYCTNCGFEALIYCDKSPYIWNPSNMNIDDIKCFGLSFGDCPNINISFDGDKLIVCNRINPRDGGMNFPDGFFDDKIVNLTTEQKENIINFIKTINFSTWKTESHTIEMLELGACGFYISESFSITFNNENTFVCHNPEYKEFNHLIDFLKSFCDNSWFEPYYGEKVDDSTVLLEGTYDSDAEYVYFPPGRTIPLDGFSDTIKLFDTNTNETIEIQKAKFDVGRNPKCEISIDDNSISRIHASFYYEKSSWFIMDKDSKNGTYLNGKRLEHNTKYELYPDDIISFAQSKNYVFFKTKSETYQENELIIILEKAIKDFSCDSSDNINILKVIALIMARIPVYFQMDYDFNEMFGNIDPAKLKIGDTITSTNDVKMKMLTLQVPNGEELIPMFTSDEQAHKGPSANLTRLYPPDYLPIVISMNKSIIINPFDENNITIKTTFLKDIVLPIVQEKLKNANEIKDENHDDIKAGTVLDNKYELLKQIGSGGLSTVYLARDIRLNKTWAVKVVKAKRNNQSNPIFNSALQEAQMMKSFSHPAIPNIVDIVVCQNFVAIVMDYVEGETLETIVKEYGAQPVDRVVDLAKQICDILCYLHSFNPPYIHRDIKPGNLVLEPKETIKLIDFGIIRQYDLMKDRDTCFLGTKGYAAPEQFGGRGQSDARTDIYGLGMTMYHLLTGIDPKETDFAVKPIRQINPSLPKGLEYIVEKCTQIDPANRYQSCIELINDLNRYQQLPPKKSFLDKIFKH